MRFDPCSEHAAQLVMSACWTAGDSDGLRHAWRRIEDALARGIDGRPSVETAELHRNLSGRPRPPVPPAAPPRDRQSVVYGQRVSARVYLGGGRRIQKKKKAKH